MKIGVMGGTFNPIHLAHLISAEQIRQGLALDQVLFVPSARPPHKSPDGIVDPEHRYQMAKLAVADNPYFFVSRIEINRKRSIVCNSNHSRPKKSLWSQM